jgi:hypothetical protein
VQPHLWQADFQQQCTAHRSQESYQSTNAKVRIWLNGSYAKQPPSLLKTVRGHRQNRFITCAIHANMAGLRQLAGLNIAIVPGLIGRYC